MPESSTSSGLLDRATDRVRRMADALRSTMADIYPVDLASQGLAPAVEELAARGQEEGGVRVKVAIVGMTEESPAVTRLSYRVIREGLRNVVRHARATQAEVLATRVGDSIYLSVDDNGVGLGDGVAEKSHLGLVLLSDTMRDVGGSLVVGPRPGGGTHLTVTFPRDLAEG
ncbi:MAG: putative two-component system sensor kinase, partial [Marmoricola sp.]|nr:putative two-component system sensor kinase [Marmoricola sp.]